MNIDPYRIAAVCILATIILFAIVVYQWVLHRRELRRIENYYVSLLEQRKKQVEKAAGSCGC